jgi:hypothetical protein
MQNERLIMKNLYKIVSNFLREEEGLTIVE